MDLKLENVHVLVTGMLPLLLSKFEADTLPQVQAAVLDWRPLDSSSVSHANTNTGSHEQHMLTDPTPE